MWEELEHLEETHPDAGHANSTDRPPDNEEPNKLSFNAACRGAEPTCPLRKNKLRVRPHVVSKQKVHLSTIRAAVASHGPLISAKYIGAAKRLGLKAQTSASYQESVRTFFFPTHLRTLNSSSAFI